MVGVNVKLNPIQAFDLEQTSDWSHDTKQNMMMCPNLLKNDAY